MYDIVSVKYLNDYVLEIEFDNGRQGTVDFKEYLNNKIFERFRDINYFKQYYIDTETKVLCWPDEVDIAPDTLYHKATGEPLPAWME